MAIHRPQNGPFASRDSAFAEFDGANQRRLAATGQSVADRIFAPHKGSLLAPANRARPIADVVQDVAVP